MDQSVATQSHWWTMKIFRRETNPDMVKIRARRVFTTRKPFVYEQLLAQDEVKIICAISIAHALSLNLSEWFQKSKNQQKRVHSFLNATMALLQKTQIGVMPKTDLDRIAVKIKKLEDDMSFEEQDSPIVHIGFVLALIIDSFEFINRTSIKDNSDELYQIQSHLEKFYEYAEKKWPDKTNEFKNRSYDLYSFWDGLFVF